jgi:branched-chain amino acid transport system permease protein
MWGIIQSSFNPYTGFGVGLKAFTAAVVGGIGNIGGAVLGGLLIGLIQVFTVGYLSSTFSDFILFSILVVFMLFRPTGIRGTPILQKV